MLNEAGLLLNGYRRFDTRTEPFKLADYLLQKCIRDDKGKKYYITVYVYDRSKYNHPYITGLGFQPEEQFREDGVTSTVDDTYHDDENTTVESMEEFFDALWAHLGKPYCDRNEFA